MKDIFRKINYILEKKQKKTLALLTVVLFVGGIFDLLGVSLIVPIVNLFTDSSAIETNKWAMLAKNILHIKSNRSLMIVLIITMIAVYVIKNLYIIGMNKLMYKIVYEYRVKLETRLLTCYMYQDYTFHLNKNVATIQRVTSDVDLFYNMIIGLLNIINQAVVCILLVAYLFVEDFYTTLGIVIILGGAIITLYKVQHRTQEERGKVNRESGMQANKWIQQSFGGIKEIQVLGREEFFLDKCIEYIKKSTIALRKSNIAQTTPKPIMEMICISCLLLIVLFRVLLGGDMADFISVLAVFALAAFRLLPSFNTISAYMASIAFQKDSVDGIYNDIIEMESLSEKKINKLDAGELKFDKEIKVNHLSYKYPNTDKWILDDVSFSIKKNESVGFMGPSGAGKSTLIDIVLGVLPIEKGSIEVDDVNIKENMKGWHNIVGYIPQTIYLMDDNIRNNVAFGIDKDKVFDERIWEALEEAQIADFVRDLPNGLDTEIGDRGVRLSGGQRQRLGIARALYNDPKVLFFDEATSALDNETEAALMESINSLKGKRTMLIIAHRLHTIENCDVIYEVSDKKVTKHSKAKKTKKTKESKDK